MAIADAASDKKALDIVMLDMRKVSGVCDYFVITSGASTTQVRAIADHIKEKLKAKKQRLWHIEGAREALWMLLDYGDVVCHVFLEETRRFYNLERLWSDAPRIAFEEGKRPKARKKLKKKPSRCTMARSKKRSASSWRSP